MKKVVLFFITAYRYLISPWLGAHCRFHPSCACYAQQAVERYGVIRGLWMGTRRLLRCHPFHPGGYDPVPEVPDTSHRSTPSETP